MTSLNERKENLLKRRAELDERLHEIDDELESHNDRDWEELAVQRESDEVLEGVGLSGMAEIKAIDAALERIEDGTYGICVKCGEDISAERLDALPYAPLCKTCAGASKH